MGFGNRDFAGSATFLSAVRGRDADGAMSEQGGGFSPESLLELLETAPSLDIEKLVGITGQDQAIVERHIEHLKKLELVEERWDGRPVYEISEIGRRARRYARMMQS